MKNLVLVVEDNLANQELLHDWLETEGFDVVSVEAGHWFVARAPDGTTSWCLTVQPLDQHSCRLISRWHARWHITPASALWIALSDPGTFIMERRMLLGIRARAERAEHAPRPTFAHYH